MTASAAKPSISGVRRKAAKIPNFILSELNFVSTEDD